MKRRYKRWLRRAERLDRRAALAGAVQNWDDFFYFGERADGIRRAVQKLSLAGEDTE